jgi:anti-sigma factor ChrR (cupin superfamily)
MTADENDPGLDALIKIWERLEQRITTDAGEANPAQDAKWKWCEPAWREAGPGLTYKILAADEARERASLMVRLAPGASYPPHSHAGVEVLHLLDGELWIDERKLLPGDYNRCEPGTSDQRVWSETGCMCLLITSTRDVLR